MNVSFLNVEVPDLTSVRFITDYLNDFIHIIYKFRTFFSNVIFMTK